MDTVLLCDETNCLSHYAVKVDVAACPGSCSADPKMHEIVDKRLVASMSYVITLLYQDPVQQNQYVICVWLAASKLSCSNPIKTNVEPLTLIPLYSAPLICEIFGGSKGETATWPSSTCLRCGHLRSLHKLERRVWWLGPKIERKG